MTKADGFFEALEVQLLDQLERRSMPRRQRILQACGRAAKPMADVCFSAVYPMFYVQVTAGKLTSELDYINHVWEHELSPADRQNPLAREAYLAGELQIVDDIRVEPFVSTVDKLRALSTLD